MDVSTLTARQAEHILEPYRTMIKELKKNESAPISVPAKK